MEQEVQPPSSPLYFFSPSLLVSLFIQHFRRRTSRSDSKRSSCQVGLHPLLPPDGDDDGDDGDQEEEGEGEEDDDEDDGDDGG
eukprot:762725-Hanusia_phi.AAC.2